MALTTPTPAYTTARFEMVTCAFQRADDANSKEAFLESTSRCAFVPTPAGMISTHPFPTVNLPFQAGFVFSITRCRV